MPEALLAVEHRLIAALQHTVRGPRRSGLFALWLVVRVCTGLLPPDPVSLRGHRRRLASLERRLSSLSLAPPLRRALAAALRELAAATPEAAAMVLQQLVAPARETLGNDAGDAIALASRAAETTARRTHAAP